MFRRLGIITVLAVILIVVITACSTGGGNMKTETKNKLTEDGRSILTLAIMESTPFFEELEKRFENKYPDIDLQIQVHKQAGEAWKYEDQEEFQQSIKTALLSGTGPDVFCLQDLNVSDYAKKGLILNMEHLLKQDETLEQAKLYVNLLDAMKQEGGTYTIPSGFYLRAFIGNGEMLKDSQINEETWSWKDFADIAKQLTQGGNGLYAMAEYTPDMLMQEMILDSYNVYVDEAEKVARFDTPEFVDLLKQVKDLYDDGVMTTAMAEHGKQLFLSSVLYKPDDVINLTYQLFDHPRFMKKPHGAEQSGNMRILLTDQFAIRADTPVQQEAWKLIRFLLSEEVQVLAEREGFSMLKSVNEQKLDEIQAQMHAGNYKLDNAALFRRITKY